MCVGPLMQLQLVHKFAETIWPLNLQEELILNILCPCTS